MNVSPNEKHDCDTESCMIACIRKGDKKAFGKLYDKYAPALLGIINGIVDDLDLAEELLQAAFLKIRSSIGAFEPSKGRFFTWMLQISRSLALESRQNQKNKQKQEIRASENFVNFPKDHHYSLESDLKNGHFQSGSGTDRTHALHLIYIKGLSYADAAGVLNTTAADLKQQIRAGLKLLSGAGVPTE